MDPAGYARNPVLTSAERTAIADVLDRRRTRGGAWPQRDHENLGRLVRPLRDVLEHTSCAPTSRFAVIALMLDAMHRTGRAYWGWGEDTWKAVLSDPDYRQYVAAFAYLLCGRADIRSLVRRYGNGFGQVSFAGKLFGEQAVVAAIERVGGELLRWGHSPSMVSRDLPRGVTEVLLANRSPHLEDITPGLLEELLAGDAPRSTKALVVHVSRALVGLELIGRPLSTHLGLHPGTERLGQTQTLADVHPEWGLWCRCWHATSTLSRRARAGIFFHLLKAGRWLAQKHPEVTRPEGWTRELSAEYVAAVDRMMIGEYTHAPTTHRQREKMGKPLSAASKDRHLGSLRTFLRDCQEWSWIPRRLDPTRSLATPRSIRGLIGPDPRVIADDTWARLMRAGLELLPEDLPIHAGTGKSWYPFEMIRALALTWLFAGLRSDELSRLRVGCVRWPQGDTTVSGTTEVLPRAAVCWLDVPVNKTGTAFTKGVDRLVGEAVDTWERVRPQQPPMTDHKTAEIVHFLFAYRGERASAKYLNHTLIPVLCHKAGVATEDARGAITSHRARTTIAYQLANGRQPLSVFELKEWLGHRYLGSTLHYVKPSPTRIAKSYADAGYLGRNVRLIEVLIDRDAVNSGAAASGSDWKFYDQGHGYCTYDFFDQCPHRMACARCSFYRPKGSGQAQLLEGKANLLRMRQELELTGEEVAAVDEGIGAFERLLEKLAEVPTPDGVVPGETAREGG